ncbi:MAG: hypothetical protein ABWZ40_11445 [Caulobacterales bacterium]
MTATLHLPGTYPPGLMKQDHTDIVRDGLILSMWSDRKDISDIASALNMRPAAVANRLAWLRDRARDV